MPRRALALTCEWAQEHRVEIMEDLGLMHPQSAPRRVPPVTVTPPIRPTRPWRVAAVNALPGFRLHVRFVDGTEGLVELADLVQSPGAGVFAALADASVFNQAFVEHGAVTWPGEIDMAPDAM
mgnify:CR=1 FL=1